MIIVKRDKNADSRTASLNTTKNDLEKATLKHIKDVSNVLEYISSMLQERGVNHDHTKLETLDQEYIALRNALENKEAFQDSNWYQMHIKEERHHFLASPKEDINLIDVIEMLADVTTASLARTNEKVDKITIDKDLLLEAFNNTLKLINDNLA